MEPGTRVKITTTDEEHEGILMPAEKDYYSIKLKTGYNMSIKKQKVMSIKQIKAAPKEVLKKSRGGKMKGLKTIAVIHTGGTVASKVDYDTGGVIASYTADDFVEMFPGVMKIANVRTRLIGNLMSEDLLFKHYRLMAKAVIEEQRKGAVGVIIGHGTDTLGYTAAALSFMLENISIPVILIGAQRSSDRPSSDAGMNMECAAHFITRSGFKGVAVCMHEGMDDGSCLILPACKTRKMHTTRRDAFKAVNDLPIARVKTDGTFKFLRKDYYKPKSDKLKPLLKMEDQVAIIRTYPNFHPDFFEVLSKKGYKGLVLESTGLGQAPTNIPENLPNYEALKAFIKKGGVVVLTSQCIYGRVHPYVYSNCRRLVDIGVIFGEDMITETAYIKLAWLLGNFPSKVNEMITTDLRGEISERTQADHFDVESS